MTGTTSLKTKRLLTRSVIAVSLLTLAACDTIGNPFEVLGRKTPAPDEFQVVARKPLVMPNSTRLPEPRLGERSPLEPNPSQDAITALLGTPSAPIVAQSGGEAALLAAANASAADGDIRARVEEDRREEDVNKPYEAPTLLELLDGDKDEEFPDTLNAEAESRRLQSEGVSAAPINPNDRPGLRPKTAESAEEQLFYETDDGKPQNTLPTQNSKPAFE